MDFIKNFLKGKIKFFIITIFFIYIMQIVLLGFLFSLTDENSDSGSGGSIGKGVEYKTSSPGEGLCAMWVSQVYQKAGLGYIGGNANDMYRNYTFTSDRKKLKVGMLVAVESCSTGGTAGRIYGHVGIYIGDGKVMDNIGRIRVITLDDWIASCCKNSPVGFGFPPNVNIR